MVFTLDTIIINSLVLVCACTDKYVVFFQACADKLKREMTEFGFPPKFPVKEEKEEAKQVT